MSYHQHNRETALAHAIAVATSGEYIGVGNPSTEIVEMAHAFTDFLDGRSQRDRRREQKVESQKLKESKKAARETSMREAGVNPKIADGLAIKLKEGSDGKPYAAGVGAAVDEAEPELAEDLQAKYKIAFSKCPHCVDLNHALLAAGAPSLSDEVSAFLSEGLSDKLHERGVFFIGELLKLTPPEVIEVGGEKYFSELLEFVMPLKMIELRAGRRKPQPKPQSGYADISIDAFSDVDPLLVKKLAASGINTIGQLTFNVEALASSVAEPTGVELLGHIVTCLEKEAEVRDDLTEEARDGVTARIDLLKRVLGGIKAAKALKPDDVIDARADHLKREKGAKPEPVATAASEIKGVREEREKAAAKATSLKDLLNDIEEHGTMVAPGVFAVDTATPQGKALLEALTAHDLEQPLELDDGSAQVRIKGARINGKEVEHDKVGALLASLLLGRGPSGTTRH